MPLQVNENKKDDLVNTLFACPMELSGWSLRRQVNGDNSISSVSMHGQDVILVEDLGTPFQTLKPLSGDFGVIALLMQDGERWLEKHQQPGVGMNAGHSIWLEWKHKNLEATLTVDNFFENYLDKDASMAPSKF